MGEEARFKMYSVFNVVLKRRCLKLYGTPMPEAILTSRRVKSMTPCDFLMKFVGEERLTSEKQDVLKFRRKSYKIMDVLALTGFAKTRCKQIVSDYCSFMTAKPDHEEMELWHDFFSPVFSGNNPLETVGKILETDLKIWKSITIFHNTSCGWHRSGINIRRMIAWYKNCTRLVPGATSLLTDTFETRDLLRLQRIYEEMMRRSKPVPDIMTYGSIWNTILREPSTVPASMMSLDSARSSYYRHSELVIGENDVRKYHLIKGNEALDLLIHDGKRKRPDEDTVNALLESFWRKTGKVIRTEELETLSRDPYTVNEGAFKFKVKRKTASGTGLYFRFETLCTRLRELRNGGGSMIIEESTNFESIKDFEATRDFENITEDIEDSEETLKLYPVHTQDYEKCVQQEQNFCEDFLLWAFSELKS